MNDLAAKYRMLYDYHTHTTYSHGTGSIADNVRAAHEKGLREIAITDHGAGNIAHGMGYAKLGKMRAEFFPFCPFFVILLYFWEVVNQ